MTNSEKLPFHDVQLSPALSEELRCIAQQHASWLALVVPDHAPRSAEPVASIFDAMRKSGGKISLQNLFDLLENLVIFRAKLTTYRDALDEEGEPTLVPQESLRGRGDVDNLLNSVMNCIFRHVRREALHFLEFIAQIEERTKLDMMLARCEVDIRALDESLQKAAVSAPAGNRFLREQ